MSGAVFPPCYLPGVKLWWRVTPSNYGNLLQKIPCMYCYTQCPQPYGRHPLSDPCLPWRLLDTHWQVRVRPLCGHCSFLLGPGVHKVLFVSAKSLFPSPCKVWQLYDGINGDLLQEGLCHTQVCCTQSPCPCGSPLLTGTSTGDAQTQFCLSFCVAPGPGVHKVCLNPLNISGRNRV